jgi:hypothetical protein
VGETVEAQKKSKNVNAPYQCNALLSGLDGTGENMNAALIITSNVYTRRLCSVTKYPLFAEDST